jgi:multiple sugar transport system substrate-binding protein
MLPSDLDRPLYEGILRDFAQAHPEIPIKPVWVTPGQYQVKLRTLLAANQAPDIFRCGDVWVANMLPFLHDITPLVERDAQQIDLDDIYPEVRAASCYKCRYYFIPSWYNVSLLYYNKKLFDERGVAYPRADWTWDNYIQAARKLTYRRPNGDQIWGSDMTTGWWGEWLIYVRQSGGDLFDPSVERCTLDSPSAVRGLEFYFDRMSQYHVVAPLGFSPPNGFAGGKIAMLPGGHVGSWVTYNKLPNLDWDIQVMPRGPFSQKGGEIAMDSWGISKTCNNPEAAWTLIKFITSKDGIRRQVLDGHLSIRRSVSAELKQQLTSRRPANRDASYRALQFGQRIPQSPDFIELAIDIVQPEVDLMLQGRQSPKQAAHKAAAAANQFMKVLGRSRSKG